MGPGARTPALQRIRSRRTRGGRSRARAARYRTLSARSCFATSPQGSSSACCWRGRLPPIPTCSSWTSRRRHGCRQRGRHRRFPARAERRRRVTILIVDPPAAHRPQSRQRHHVDERWRHPSGTVDEVLQEDRLRALYGVPVRLGSVAGQRTLVVEQRYGLRCLSLSSCGWRWWLRSRPVSRSASWASISSSGASCSSVLSSPMRRPSEPQLAADRGRGRRSFCHLPRPSERRRPRRSPELESHVGGIA